MKRYARKPRHGTSSHRRIQDRVLRFDRLEDRSMLAANFVVNTTLDTVDINPGDGIAADAQGLTSLRAAIMEANALSGNDTILLPAGTYTLTRAGFADDTAESGDLDITDGLTISGAGASQTIIDAGGDNGIGERIFEVIAGTETATSQFEFHDMTLTGGRTGGNIKALNEGGALRIDFYNEVLVSNVTFTDNKAPNYVQNSLTKSGMGGAILSHGALEVRNSRFENNFAAFWGGAISTYEAVFDRPEVVKLDIVDSTFSGNRSEAGGAILTAVPSTISGSTLNNNEVFSTNGSLSYGGAIDFESGTYSSLIVSNSTISGNRAPDRGGIAVDFFSPFSLLSSTVVNNEGGGIYRTMLNDPMIISNSIVAGNSRYDVSAFVDSQGHNLIGVGSTSGSHSFDGPGDIVGRESSPFNPRLGPLADNGGPTFTHALLPDSPAIDAGSLATATDQRGVSRPQGLNADIGAFEREEIAPIAADDEAFIDIGTTAVIDVLANDMDRDGDPFQIEAVTQGDHGTVTINGDGTLTYVPEVGFEGEDSFVYLVSDGISGTSSATVTVYVGPVNTPPVAEDDAYSTYEDVPLYVGNAFLDTLDQTNERADGLHTFNAKLLNLQQQVVAGKAGILQSVDVFVGPHSEVGGKLDFYVSIGPPWNVGLRRFQTTYTLQEGDIDGWLTIDVSSANIRLDQGETFTIGTRETDAASVFLWATNSDLSTGDNYSPGSLWADGAVRLTPIHNDYDLLFRTRMVPPSFVADGVLTNDTDADGDALSATIVSQPTRGTIELASNGSFKYTPDANVFGSDSFTYSVSDGRGKTDTATVSLTIYPTNDPPTTVDDEASLFEDQSVVIDLLGNDSDVDGVSLTLTDVTSPSHGSIRVNADQTVTYTPAANYYGTDGFTYSVADGLGAISTGQVSVTIFSKNDVPVANDDLLVLDEDTQISINVLDNDTDVDGDTLQAIYPGTPKHGVAIFSIDGSLTYIPNINFFGTDSFTYTANDLHGGTNKATVFITVNPIDDAPIAVDDAVTTAEDTPITFSLLANDIDYDGDTLSIDQISTPAHGLIEINGDGTVTFTPQEDFNGIQTMGYRISDGNGFSEWSTISITITPVNDPPTGTLDNATTDEDASVVISVLNNDSDIDGDDLSVTGVSNFSHGTAVINADGTVTFTPDPNFNGNGSFSYTLSDGKGGTTAVPVSVTINPINDPPVAVNDTFDFLEDHGYLLQLVDNDTDIDGDPLVVLSVSSPVHGRVEERPAGWIYLPDANFYGTETLSYEVSDGQGGTDTATIVIHVSPVNDAPSGTDDEASTDEDVAVEIDVLANDTDVEDDPLNVTAVSDPTHGVAEVTGAGTIRYTPAADFHGSDSFTYTLGDGSGKTDTATVVVSVAATNDPPVATNDTAATDQDKPVIIPVLANDTDIDGDLLAVLSTSDPSYGTLQINGDGTITYTPNAQFTGTDSFTYTMTDGQGEQATATVEVSMVDTTNASIVSVTLGRQGATPPAPDQGGDVPFFNEWQTVASHIWLDVEEVLSDGPVDIVVHVTSSSSLFLDPEIFAYLGASATLESTHSGDSRLTTLTLSDVDLSTYVIGDRVLIGTLLFQADTSDPAGLSATTAGEYAHGTTDIGFALEDALIVDGKTFEVTPQIDGSLGPVIYDHDEDGRVGLSDFTAFVIAFGKYTNETNPEAYRFDYDRNGRVSLSDFSLFVQYFGYAKPIIADITLPGLSSPLPAANRSTVPLETEPLALEVSAGESSSAAIPPPDQDVPTDNSSDAVLGILTPSSTSETTRTFVTMKDSSVAGPSALDPAPAVTDVANMFDPRVIDAIVSDDVFLESSTRHSSEEEPWDETLAAISDHRPTAAFRDR